jgi:ABC-2 type transport system ATP-binding protein
VSHNLAQVERICNKAMILDHGRMLAYGDIEEIAPMYEKFVEEQVEVKPKKKKTRKKVTRSKNG